MQSNLSSWSQRAVAEEERKRCGRKEMREIPREGFTASLLALRCRKLVRRLFKLRLTTSCQPTR
jgi:hypothetical protein